MAKRSNNAAGIRTSSKPGQPSRGTSEDKPEAPGPLAKSANPAYTKFTTYIRKSTHLGVKIRLVTKSSARPGMQRASK